MKKCSALTLLACVFALLTAERAAAAPVTWDFIATSCIDGPCGGAAHYPVTVATLTLPGPDSMGSASWPFGIDVATYTGDSFAFSFDRDGPLKGLPLTPAFIPQGGCASGFQLCDFNISWTETAGALTALTLQVDGFDDNVGNIVRGGIGSLAFLNIASMNGYAPCAAGGSCEVAGSWTDAPSAVPEPGSLAVLASAFGVWGLIGRRRVLHAV